MATAYTSLLGLALPVTGELSGSWGDTVNDEITSLLDTAVAGTTSITADADITLTTTTGVANQSRQAIILWNPASGTTTRNITAPAQSKIYTVINASGGTQSIVFRGAGPTTGVTIVKGESAVVAWNGTDFIKVSNTGGAASFTNVTVSGTTTLSGLTASTALALDASKNVVSVTNTGTGNNVLATSPTLVTPALGTPSSATLTNATGLPVSTGISGLGTGIATALAVNVGTAGAPVINGGVLGTPSSGTVTNLTGTASININGTVGATTANSGAFTTLSATGVTTVQAGSAGAPAITTSGDTNTGIFFPAADTIAFSEGGVESMRIDASGNLGLGVTPSASTFPAIESSVGIFMGRTENNLGVNAYFNSGWKYTASSTAATRYRQNAGEHQWYNAPSGTAGNAISFTQAMTLDASGNLALGTTNATGQAANNRVIQIYGAGTANRAQIHFCNSDTGETATDGSFIGVDTNRDLFIINGESANTIFENNGAERARINSAGDLLVGTTSVLGAGKISSVSANNGISAQTTAAANTYEAIVASRNGNVGKVITLWHNVVAGVQAGFINIDSTSTVSLNNTSDYRVKENIQPLTGAVERVKNLKPVSFNYKADGYFAEGFIAHEFAEVIPQAVHGEKDAVDEAGKPVYQALDQSKIIPLLTAAIQELKAEFDAYKASHP
jgi:hypothetical protein